MPLRNGRLRYFRRTHRAAICCRAARRTGRRIGNKNGIIMIYHRYIPRDHFSAVGTGKFFFADCCTGGFQNNFFRSVFMLARAGTQCKRTGKDGNGRQNYCKHPFHLFLSRKFFMLLCTWLPGRYPDDTSN